ncbi:MAG: hypothetical protein ACPGSC_04185 [Granulosicoccaceae bacterium]
MNPQLAAVKFSLAVFCLLSAGCDEQTPLINEDNALRAASCALSPTELPELSNLAFVIGEQTAASCLEGVLLRNDFEDGFTIQADHCLTATGTLLRGNFSKTDITATPVTVEWDFDNISTTTNDTGSSVDGVVRAQQVADTEQVELSLSFDYLSLDDIENAIAIGNLYGKTSQTIVQALDGSSVSIDYQSDIEYCGFDSFALETKTLASVLQLVDDPAPREGVIEATAQDGSTLTISIDGELLALALDSNGDQVDDLRMSMSWGEFTVASAAARARPVRPLPETALPRFRSSHSQP